MSLFLLLRPRRLALVNRWTRIPAARNREIIMLALSAAMMVMVFKSTEEILVGIDSKLHILRLVLVPIFNLMLSGLTVLILFSAAVTTLSSFFLAQDLDLILASPVTRAQFFTGKFLGVFGNSSWMGILFGLPAIFAFGAYFNAPWGFYPAAVALVSLYLIPVMCLAIIAVMLFSLLFPANRSREVILLAGGTLIVIAFLLLHRTLGVGKGAADHMAILTSILEFKAGRMLPSHWVAQALSATLNGQWMAAGEFLLPLLAFILPHLLLAFAATLYLYPKAFSRARSSSNRVWTRARTIKAPLPSLPLPRYIIAIWSKEYRVFSRDMVQAFQLLLLLGLTLFYLYNFRVIGSVTSSSAELNRWWQAILVLANIGFGGFVLAAVGNRFVFPAVSFEGQGFWMIEAAPISIEDYLWAKFWYWMLPIATISSVVLTSGALAFNAEPHIVGINAVASWIISYGIVGLGIGLGAHFSSFTWEHITQVTASFGSLVYILSCSALIALNLIPAGLLLALRVLRNSGVPFTPFQWYLCITSAAALLVYLNVAATRWALTLGTRTLTQRQSGLAS